MDYIRVLGMVLLGLGFQNGNYFMRHLLPNRIELAVFALVAIFCSGIVMSGMIDYDLMLSMLAAPLFICAAVMGLRRSPQWADDETDEQM